MKGHVPTPPAVVDVMVDRLFSGRPPGRDDFLIDPGCGDGPFIGGVLRYCESNGMEPPRILGVDLNERLLARARQRLGGHPSVELRRADYLLEPCGPADYILGNPPYVSITSLDHKEKATYRARYATASGRFDLYLLFFERSLQNLRPGGRLCLITPEKFEYVHTAQPLRKLLAKQSVEELTHLGEETFPGLVTYPTITTLTKSYPAEAHQTSVRHRDGRTSSIRLPPDGRPWSGLLNGHKADPDGLTLSDVSLRVSCGIATGADDVFVLRKTDLPQDLAPHAWPTISGRQLGTSHAEEVPTPTDVMVIPYDADGVLLLEHDLGSVAPFLKGRGSERLRKRTCVTRGSREWYRFHDNVPFRDMLLPKLLCKDITSAPHFWADRRGEIVPRHSVYYIVPRPGIALDALQRYLNGSEASAWLIAHCQRAANGFFRLQSAVLKRLPVPTELARSHSRQPVTLARWSEPMVAD